MEEGIARNNVFYGGLNPGVQNVFFTHGKSQVEISQTF